MKEELKALKDSAEQIVKACQSLQRKKAFFNMKVEEKKEETGIIELIEMDSSYESAKVLNENFSSVHALVTQIRKEHPKYGNRRIKELVLKQIHESSFIPEDLEDKIELAIDNYFLYESCGFFKLLEQEKEIEELGNEAMEATDVILDESKAAAIKAGKAVISVVKPYGEVAKSQLNDAGEATKKAINKGSQKLKKFFENVEEKTRTK